MADGVVAGVDGIERVLPSPISAASGWTACVPALMPELVQSYGLLELLSTLDALVGGVGNVCARSRPGRVAPPPLDAMACAVEEWRAGCVAREAGSEPAASEAACRLPLLKSAACLESE